VSFPKPNFRLFIWMLYAVALGALVYFLATGLDYYLLPLDARPHHPWYPVLKPGGLRSHGLGVIGSAMMLLLLLYSLRKRTRLFGDMGTMSQWLHVHIFLGIMGPLFVILHTTFKLNGLVAVSFWSMIIVALSGALGRFLYNQIPHNIQGQELSLEEVHELRRSMEINLKEQFHLDDNWLKELDELLTSWLGKRETLTGFALWEIRLFIGRSSLKRLIVQRFPIKKSDAGLLLQMARRKVVLERRIQLWQKIHQLFHYWHVFHKPFALIMYVIMFIHVGIAIWLGYTWIF